jgi:ubiquinone/menaquinone biosynthesis C-methylase UbiE
MLVCMVDVQQQQQRGHHAVVNSQFGPRAQSYVDSPLHSSGPDLDALAGILQAASPVRALDVGTGGGHVAYLMAGYAEFVTATDLSSDMVAVVARTARERGLDNVQVSMAPVEQLPFDNAWFDFVASRLSAHHWTDLDASLREIRRVVKHGAPVVFIDAFSPSRVLLDTHLQAVELLRDMSHVRDYTTAEWHAALSRAGFSVCTYKAWRLRLEFSSWISRMQTPRDNVRAIRALQAAAAEETGSYFAIEPDGSFMLDVHMLETRAH